MEADRCRATRAGGWPKLLIAALTIAYVNTQDISMCCTKADGTCRSVCEKMSLVPISDNDMREERIRNIYKFCTPQLTEFWICMNHTIEEVVDKSGWWGRACCALGIAASCRHGCARAQHEQELLGSGACRHSDELAFFDCVQGQREAQWCCSQTQSLNCYEACRAALWPGGAGASRERALDACEQSPPLQQCLRNMTASTVHADTAKYLPCCHESPRPACRTACEAALRRAGAEQEIERALTGPCGAPALHDRMWQCFLRSDAPADTKDLIPHDVAKLHCCQKAKTTNCRKLCFETFNTGWQNNWQKFYGECLGDPQENDLTECIEEVESPCTLGCNSLTYCSQLNNRPTSLFRSCTAQADLDAHLAVAEQKGSGSITVSGLHMPLKNSTQCPTDVWKSVACALHVKPCTAKGHSSLLCAEDCLRLVSSCVEWSRAPPLLTAAGLCARLAPRNANAPCVQLRQYMSPSTEPALLSARETVASPCAGAACNASQVCAVNRNCLHGGGCSRYHCTDGCPLGDGSNVVIPIGSWARVPRGGSPSGGSGGAGGTRVCFKLCRCTRRGLTACQPLPCVGLDNCRLLDKVFKHGAKYFVECNACACAWGAGVCAARACGRARQLTRLPCNCPPHHLRVYSRHRLFPNACLAKCAGATDAEVEFGPTPACARGACGRREACLELRNVCLSRLQKSCPQHVCVNTSNCSAQPPAPVCDSDGVTHANPCHFAMSGKRLAYWGPCLNYCSSKGTVCGVNGVTYSSECAAWAEYVSMDYLGPCVAVGALADGPAPACSLDRVSCPARRCAAAVPPGACCPRCGGALRLLYSRKQIDRALYGTNISATVNLHNILSALERHVRIAECALRGYLTIESEIFVSIESLLPNPTDLQLEVCVLEAERLADMINRESALISIDLGLSALVYALPVHAFPAQGASSIAVSLVALTLSYFASYVLR